MNALKLIVCALLLPAMSGAAETWQAADFQQALEGESRSAADKARDTGRKPVQIVALLDIAPGMTVLDLMAASGYYTEVLSIAVGPDGRVYAQNPQWMLEFMKGVVDKALSQRLTDDRLPNVVRVDGDADLLGMPENSIDGALSALNFHDVYYDYGADAALAVLQQVYAVLKPGAAFVLIDHAGNAGLDNKALHRILESDVRDLALQAGFAIDAAPDLLSNPADDGTQMVFAKGLRGNTDRFVLQLRK